MFAWVMMIVVYVVIQGQPPSQPMVSFERGLHSQDACEIERRRIEAIETVKGRVKVRTVCFVGRK